MREIKFRGRTKSGEWLVGSLYKTENKAWILGAEPTYEHFETDASLDPFIIDLGFDDGDANEVIPETIGQYIGLQDKDGKYIYEGDIVRTTRKNWEGLYVCEWLDGQSSYIFRALGTSFNHPIWFGVGYLKAFEVVGNIYDNPELLRGIYYK